MVIVVLAEATNVCMPCKQGSCQHCMRETRTSRIAWGFRAGPGIRRAGGRLSSSWSSFGLH